MRFRRLAPDVRRGDEVGKRGIHVAFVRTQPVDFAARIHVLGLGRKSRDQAIEQRERLGMSPALGLLVAVPAVWLFNYFTGKVDGFVVEMDNSASELVDYFIKNRTKQLKA